VHPGDRARILSIHSQETRDLRSCCLGGSAIFQPALGFRAAWTGRSSPC
jgi:hypothetical protein